MEEGPLSPSGEIVDEVLLFSLLFPLCYCNLRAPVRDVISCTDASEEGGAAGEASRFVDHLKSDAALRLEDFWQKISEESTGPHFLLPYVIYARKNGTSTILGFMIAVDYVDQDFVLWNVCFRMKTIAKVVMLPFLGPGFKNSL